MTPTKLMQPTMPTGMSTAGFLTSSARVETQSNPMKEKNTKEAPLNILQAHQRSTHVRPKSRQAGRHMCRALQAHPEARAAPTKLQC